MGYALIDETGFNGLPRVVVAGPEKNEAFWDEARSYMEDLYGQTIRPEDEYREAYDNDEEVEPAERQFYDLKGGLGVEGWTLDEDVTMVK